MKRGESSKGVRAVGGVVVCVQGACVCVKVRKKRVGVWKRSKREKHERKRKIYDARLKIVIRYGAQKVVRAKRYYATCVRQV